MNTNISQQPQELDIMQLYLQLKDKYRNVFIYQFGDQVYFYKSLGRKDYKIISENRDLNDFQKENVICDHCVLYPQNIDWNEVEAGIPEKLTEMILKNSFLDSLEARQKLLAFYRTEMYDLDNQISCLINEAFPQFDLEDIEEWGVEKTTKYLSRAEWKLHNLRGLAFVEPEGNFSSHEAIQHQQQEQRPVQKQQSSSQQKTSKDDRTTTSSTSIRGNDKRTSKLTPEKIKEMQEFQKRFPEINVFGDEVLNNGFKGMDGIPIDVGSPALRTPSGRTYEDEE